MRVSDLTTSTYVFDGASVESVEGAEDDLALTSTSSQIRITFPDHCNHRVSYTFKISKYRNVIPSMLEHSTEEIEVISTNSIDFNRNMEVPIILEFLQGSIDEW